MRELGLPEVLVICGILFLFGLLLVLAVGLLHRKRRDSVQKTLIEKFGSAHDLGTFLGTPGGERFIDSLANRINDPRQSVLASIRGGIILSMLGLGCWLVALWGKMPAMGIPALLLACLGVALLVSALVSYRLSKAWGLFDQAATSDVRKPLER